MSAYLSGDKIPESVPRYVTSENGEKISGRTIVADTMQDGAIKQRPIFYVGYGHWDYAENSVDYFAGWTNYTTGIRDGGLLQIYHGAENGSETQIQPSAQQQDNKIDYTGNSLLVVTDSDSKITNKTGLVMAADSTTKDYPYHIRFKLPKQNSDKDNYAGARLYFDVQVAGEQTQN